MQRQNFRTGEVLGSNIEFFTCFTLVDISDTGEYDPLQSQEYEEAQNLNTLMQAVSLRSQPTLSSIEILENQDLADYDFGSSYSGSHSVWVLRFASERAGSITVNFLETDVSGLPVFTSLLETATIPSSVFETTAASRNIYFIRNDNL